MTDDDESNVHGNLEVDATASRDGLSLKAKGAGLFVLLAIDIVGMIFIGYQLTQKDSDINGYVPLLFLLYIGYQLVSTLDATLGLRKVHRD